MTALVQQPNAGVVVSTPPGAGASAIPIWGAASVAMTTVTRYLLPGYADVIATTTLVQYRAPRAGNLRNLRVRQNLVGTGVATISYTLRVNSVATALSVTMAANAADGSDLTNTVAIAAGDLLDLEVTKPAMIAGTPGEIIAALEWA